ncbi:HWE histidine kinase domain-containing protein [Roseivivax isoporae]|uniref:histidine kinase n=1 Tax=Roseivivax isoporae LMG 25204 TaxID=1449351 RepID=X7F540_9RHOB|nr:HWE histidine kinase domain-containing protein [Roseivivax isoporae]ETX27211.1 histidine kinase [Roseivivax isoporae LMG 25204]
MSQISSTHDTFGTDLTECDREPIHLLGRVQSYGALLAVSSDWMVQYASANLADMIGPGAHDPLGRPLADILPDEALRLVRARLRNIEGGERATRIFDFPIQDRHFDVSVHQSGRHLVIEFEPRTGENADDVLAATYPLIQRVRNGTTVEEVAQQAARGLQLLSGFDSVMVYQFQKDASGKVIAEARDGDRPSYLGLRFPASDIPQQARALYSRSLLRLIADVNDPGVPIRPDRSPEGDPLDLSLAVTRAVSPVHIEYLRNMGVGSSMSVSIMKDGALWGLFACHSSKPRFVPFETRTAIELFGHLFAYELTRLQERKRTDTESGIRALQSRLMHAMADGSDLAESLVAVSDELGATIPHDGMALFTDGRLTLSGSTPGAADFAALTRFLNTTAASRVYATDALGRDLPAAEAYSDAAAGMLAIPISRSPRDYLVLFRREERQTVTWAGKPDKVEDGLRLSPRKSFAAWEQEVRGQSLPWDADALQAADALRALLLEIFLRISDAANAERKRAQERQELLIAELNHRVRNILNLMRGLISQSRRSETTLDRFASSLDGRIQALARAHDQLTRTEWAPCSLIELMRLELAAYVEDTDRARIVGDDVLVAPDAYSTLALVLHEMTTNSVKHGALGAAGGRLEIALTRDAAGAVEIAWVETGGPVVRPPERRGFGTAIVERSIPYELHGEAELDYRMTGVRARFRVPPRHLSEPENIVPLQRVTVASGKPAARLTGRALVVEDAMIIAMDAADILSDLGAGHVDIAANVEEGLAHVAANTYEVALLDVDLGGQQSVRVAEALARQGVPFVLATGYGENGDLRMLYPPCRIIQKPFSNDTIAAALADSGFATR